MTGWASSLSEAGFTRLGATFHPELSLDNRKRSLLEPQDDVTVIKRKQL